MKNNLIKIHSIYIVSFLFLISSITPIVFGYNTELSYLEAEENNLYEKPTALSGPMDSPWPMKCQNNRHTGLSPYSTADNPMIEKWRFKCNWIEDGIVIGDDGTLYFGDTWANFYAFYPNGTLKWTYKTGESITSAPAIDEDGTIYIGSWDFHLYAIYPNGTLKWKFKTHTATITSSPAIAEDGTIYFGTLWSLGNGGKIFAVNSDGTEKWRYQTGDAITSDPAIGDDGTVYIGSMDDYLYALYPNGTLKWRFKTGDYVKGPPSIGDDGTIYIGSWDDYLYALYSDGTMKWKCKIGSGTSSNPSIGIDGTIYVGGDKLYAIYPNGTIKWIFILGPAGSSVGFSCPAISAEGTIYVGANIGYDDGGYILALFPDGTEKWRKRLSLTRDVDSSPCIAEDGTVYIGSTYDQYKGYLHAFGPVESNVPPDTPTITGTTNGKAREEYYYTFTSIDPDNNPVSYYIDWGDDTTTETMDFASGEIGSASHTYNARGEYTIKAKARDTLGEESDWATLEVSMPKNKPYINTPFIQFLDNHPYMFLILRKIFGN